MQVEITHKFQKQIKDCNDLQIRSKVLRIIETVIDSKSITTIPNIKKLTGYKNSYRIRLGNYRIGLFKDDNTVVFAAFDHRADIYKYFP